MSYIPRNGSFQLKYYKEFLHFSQKKAVLTFQGTQLSSSNKNKILTFSQKKAFPVFSLKEAVVIFPETEFSSSITKKIPYIF